MPRAACSPWIPRTVGAALLLALCQSPAPAPAQVVAPSQPQRFGQRSLGERGSGGAVVAPPAPGESRTIVIEYVAVSPPRDWTNAEGQTIQARLLAFSAPKAGETGPVEVIRDGKVRFLLLAGAKEPVEYPLASLSPADQVQVRAIAQAAKDAARQAEEDARKPAADAR